MENPVSFWAFLARVTVERGDPRGHPAFQTCPLGAIPILQPAYTAKRAQGADERWGLGEEPHLPHPAPAPWAPDLYLSRLTGEPPAPLGPAWPSLLRESERPGTCWCRAEADVDRPALGASAAGEGGPFACSPRCSQVLPCVTYQLRLQCLPPTWHSQG